MFLTGFILCVYPMFAAFISDIRQVDIIGTYEISLNENKDLIKEEREKAEEYNKALYEKDNIVFRTGENDILSENSYYSIYDITGTGIMGSIEIPDIKVKLPVYHGTSEKTLSTGAGHMEGTSFPIGETNSHSVITGHRGLPDANLFLRLDELEKGDLFYINSGNDVLAYKIIRTLIVEPDNLDFLEIEEGRDLVSLVTCTPYGINTHRLIVTGERTVITKEEEKEILHEKSNKMSIRRGIMMFLPFMLLLTGVIIFVLERKRRG